MGNTLKFTSGQLQVLDNIVGLTPVKTAKQMQVRLRLLSVLDFTEEEKKAIKWTEFPDGNATFNPQIEMERHILPRQRSQLIDLVKANVAKLTPQVFQRMVVPALLTLGYDFMARGDNDNDDEGDE